MTERTPAIERLMARVAEVQGPMITPCWISSYHPASKGYVQVRDGGKWGPLVMGHRLSYEHYIGQFLADFNWTTSAETGHV